MIEEILYGMLVSVCTIAIQVAATLLLIRTMHRMSRRIPKRERVFTLTVLMVTTGVLLTIAHVLEVAVWALSYILVGAAPRWPFYLAFVNFTTLGYGDVLPVPEWHLLGPMTAANGMLLFGWSTALIFAILSRAVETLKLE